MTKNPYAGVHRIPLSSRMLTCPPRWSLLLVFGHLVIVERTKTTSSNILHNVANRARVQCARDGPGTLGSRKPGCAKRKPRANRSIRSISTGTIFHKRTGSFAFCRHIGEPSGRPFCHEACGAPTAIHSGAGIRKDATHVYVAARSGASKSASLPIPRHPICSRAQGARSGRCSPLR